MTAALSVIEPGNVATYVVSVPAPEMTSVPVPVTCPVTPEGSLQFPTTVRIFPDGIANVPTQPVQSREAAVAPTVSTVTVDPESNVPSIMTESEFVGTPAPPEDCPVEDAHVFESDQFPPVVIA